MKFLPAILILALLSPVFADTEWAVTFREGRDPGNTGHYKIEIEEDEIERTNLSTRAEKELSLDCAEVERLKALIEKYVHRTDLEVSDERIRDFLEVEFEYSEENKSIEVEFTFPADAVPSDIREAFERYRPNGDEGS